MDISLAAQIPQNLLRPDLELHHLDTGHDGGDLPSILGLLFSDLPTVAPRGFVTEIIGDASSSFDNYFCVFEPSDAGDAFGSGTWKETVKPGIPCKLDPATLPHALIRQADGTFTFGPLEWGERICGDEDSAPFPSFVGRTLNGLFFYRNRLSFLSGENVVMSEVGEFFNFFLTTVTTLVDSDVVDVAALRTQVEASSTMP